jgi:hypothetical protein
MFNFSKFALGALLLMVGGCAQMGDDGVGTEPKEVEFEVVEYLPAPGQFVNEGYTANTMAEACEYAQQRLENRYFVSLGGFGGYLVVKFKTPIVNSGDFDFGIFSNHFATSSEPGVVWVSQDANGNGVADDEWFELYGSESDKPTTMQNYSITYSRTDDASKIAWRDSDGESGIIERNSAHTQDYFPAWIEGSEYTLSGTLLPDNAVWSEINQEWNFLPFEWGYVDNYSSIDCYGRGGNLFCISNARTANGEVANLSHIDFVKIQSATNATHTPVGETSTEVCGFILDI